MYLDEHNEMQFEATAPDKLPCILKQTKAKHHQKDTSLEHHDKLKKMSGGSSNIENVDKWQVNNKNQA